MKRWMRKKVSLVGEENLNSEEMDEQGTGLVLR